MKKTDAKMMKAVVRYDNRAEAIEIREVPVPEIGSEDVLVRVAFAGICGTDPHDYRRSVAGIDEPLIQGHEFSGTIEEVGSKVSGYSIGDRVLPEVTPYYCGQCSLCRSGRQALCREAKTYGFGMPGVYAEYVKAPASALHRIPDNVSLRSACMTEPFAVAYQAVLLDSSVRPGDTVVVVGPGPIGIFCTIMAKLAGASEIIVVGTDGDDSRLKCAQSYGATMTINSSMSEPLERILSSGDGRGTHLVVDAAGPASVLELAIKAVRPGGQITKIAPTRGTVTVDLDPLIYKSVALRGHFGIGRDVWERCLALMASGQVDLEPMITHELPLYQWKQGYELIERREAVKVILTLERV